MGQVGLDYLALSRSAKTLSGGEGQRIRLSAQLGSNLRGVLYVLDEPTIGLAFARDNEKLLDTLDALKRKGNSLIVDEHDEDTMRRADSIVDLGPGAGSRGGAVVAQGTIAEIQKIAGSATGKYLREPVKHPTRGERRSMKDVTRWIELKGATLHNLKGVDAKFPDRPIECRDWYFRLGKKHADARRLETGGDGQSEAAPQDGHAWLRRNQRRRIFGGRLRGRSIAHRQDLPLDAGDLHQGSLTKSALLVLLLLLARIRGYTASRFSFNAEGGRCEMCQGQGVIKVEMNFLPTESYVPLHRLPRSPLQSGDARSPLQRPQHHGDVMEMTALNRRQLLFAAQPKIHRPLALLCETGLGYLKLGQPSPTLSGGEAQRLKLVSELTRGLGRAQTARIRQNREAKSTLVTCSHEEPTIGLHMADVVQTSRSALHRLVDDGNTVIVIEHNVSPSSPMRITSSTLVRKRATAVGKWWPQARRKALLASSAVGRRRF